MAEQRSTGTKAPEFTLTDTKGQEVSLSQFHGETMVVLVLNRGFS